MRSADPVLDMERMKMHSYRTKTARMLRECFHLEMDLFACQMREYKDRRKDSPFHQIRGAHVGGGSGRRCTSYGAIMNETSTVLLILGMHRGGTSAVAGVLARPLLTQWKREMEKLVVGLGLTHVSITRNTANVTRFLDSKLRHHQVSRAPQQGPFRNLSIQIFEGMQESWSSHLPTKIQQVSRQIDLLHQQHLLSLVRSLRSTGISHVPI